MFNGAEHEGWLAFQRAIYVRMWLATPEGPRVPQPLSLPRPRGEPGTVRGLFLIRIDRPTKPLPNKRLLLLDTWTPSARASTVTGLSGTGHGKNNK